MKDTTNKKDFLNYILHNYEFIDRTAVWILNFIKSNPLMIGNIQFSNVKAYDKTLRITSSNVDKPTLIMVKGNTVIHDGETIFHELNMYKDERVYLMFLLDKEDVRYQAIIDREIDLTHLVTREDLLMQIDEALDSNDKQSFTQLSEQLKRLEEKSR